MNRNALIVALLLLGISPAASADTLFGLYVGAGVWQQDFSGDVASGITDVDIEDDLGLDDEMNNVFYVAIEHGVPALPNFRVQKAEISVTGNNLLTRTIEFNGATFSVSEAVDTEIELDQIDGILYYEILDNVVSLDLGLAARKVDGLVEVVTLGTSSRADFDGVLPMLYGKVRADLPLTGFWVAAEGMGVSYSGDQLIDVSAQVGYESDFGFGIEAGYRTFRLELDEFDDINVAEIDVSGPYAALNYHF